MASRISDFDFFLNLRNCSKTPRRLATAGSGDASVAILLRFHPKTPSPLTAKSLKEYLTFPSAQTSPLELLYIKRASRATDRWSGHVAFPGGKKEANESPLECAIRETHEEIGIDLNQPDTWHFLGELGDWLTLNRIVVKAFCWIQINGNPLQMNLQESEVHSANWVKLQYFGAVKSSPIKSLVNFPPRPDEKQTTFPGLQLPTENVQLANNQKAKEFILWGMTLSVTIYLLKQGQFAPMTSLQAALEETRNCGPQLAELLTPNKPKL